MYNYDEFHILNTRKNINEKNNCKFSSFINIVFWKYN